MDTFVARLLQPAPLLVATLVAALIALIVAVVLAVALAPGAESISVALTDTSPFRWA